MREKIVRYLEENKITAMELSRRSGHILCTLAYLFHLP